MTIKLRKQIKLWATTWQEAGLQPERLRQEAVRRADTTKAFLILTDAFQSARRNSRPVPVPD